jgi:hypothetical protein
MRPRSFCPSSRRRSAPSEMMARRRGRTVSRSCARAIIALVIAAHLAGRPRPHPNPIPESSSRASDAPAGAGARSPDPVPPRPPARARAVAPPGAAADSPLAPREPPQTTRADAHGGGGPGSALPRARNFRPREQDGKMGARRAGAPSRARGPNGTNGIRAARRARISRSGTAPVGRQPGITEKFLGGARHPEPPIFEREAARQSEA